MHCISIIHCNKLYFSQGGGETELVSGVYTFSLNQIEKQTRKEKSQLVATLETDGTLRGLFKKNFYARNLRMFYSRRDRARNKELKKYPGQANLA
jgi:hypothetical protein